jgi:hypothetical protein
LISLLNFIFKKLFNFLILFFNYNKIINFITKIIELDNYFIQYKFYQKNLGKNRFFYCPIFLSTPMIRNENEVDEAILRSKKYFRLNFRLIIFLILLQKKVFSLNSGQKKKYLKKLEILLKEYYQKNIQKKVMLFMIPSEEEAQPQLKQLLWEEILFKMILIQSQRFYLLEDY